MCCVGISSGLKCSFLKVGKKEEDERQNKGTAKTTPPNPQKPRGSGSSESCMIHEVPFQGYTAANDHWGRGDALWWTVYKLCQSFRDVAFVSLPSC